jgi:HTH-type transcriptional regulator / antitoxin HigA
MRTVDPQRYAELLAQARPGIIESPEEHDRLLEIAEQLMDRGETISAEEEKLLALLVLLIEQFEGEFEEADEDGEDEVPAEPPEPHVTLRRLLEGRGLELADIADVFGNPANAREAIEGRRPITRGQAKQLSKYFRVPVKLFTS